MGSRTESELRFETLCRMCGIAYHRIEESVEKTPDYDLAIADYLIAFEVKQLDANDDDVRILNELALNRSAAFYGRSAERLREKIRQSCRQLKQRTRKTRPGVLVVYNHGSVDEIDHTDIKNAMYGYETWDVREFPDRTEITPRLGKSRMCTPKENTTLSGIALMHDGLDFFHNVHAACPIDPKALVELCHRQFTINLSQPGRLPEWEEVVV